MKITITDGNSTVTLENSEGIESARTRKLLDVLFGSEVTATPTVIIGPSADRRTVEDLMGMPAAAGVTLPSSPVEFETWLKARSPAEAALIIGKFVGGDIRAYLSVNALINNIPRFGIALGYLRFRRVCTFIHENGWIASLPGEQSMRTYFCRSKRIGRRASAARK